MCVLASAAWLCFSRLYTLQRVHVYEAVTYEGTPTESEEMRPQWFNVADLPFKVRTCYSNGFPFSFTLIIGKVSDLKAGH